MQIPEKPELFGASVSALGTPNEVVDHKDDIFFAAIETTPHANAGHRPATT